VHRHGRYIALVGACLLLVSIALSAPVSGFDLPRPDHGVERDGFDKLWSGYNYSSPGEGASAVEYLTRGSDYFYIEPPGAPSEWNDGEARSFDGGGSAVSVHPPDANLTDGDKGIIHDAYVSVFAVSPSTVAHYSPERTSRYVGTSGTVYAFVDYRVEDADGDSVEVGIVETGDKVSGTGGVGIDYSGLTAERLTVRARVKATRDTVDGEVTDTVVVEDEMEVQPYNVSSRQSTALTTTYPDGDTAAFVVRGTPWSSVSVSNSTIHSNWRFFSARDTDWDEPLVVERETSTTEGERYHPLRVHAYPSEGGVSLRGRGSGGVEVRDIFGDTYDSPESTLPRGVNVNVVGSSYKTTRALDLRYRGSGGIEVTGIVSGAAAPARTPPVPVPEISATNLSMSVVDRGPNGVNVRVSLRDEAGDPIYTRSAGGYVRLEGRRNVTTEIGGTTVVNVSPKPSGAVFARYVPNDWHDSIDGRRGRVPYEGDSATLIVRDRFDLLGELGMLIRLGVFLVPLLLTVYMLDRAFGLGVWPPWRRL